MEGNNVISVKDLSFSYNGEPILENINFDVPQGSLTALIGPNGSGKTTLLKVLLGFLEPKRGSVSVLGTKPAYIRKKVGYVPQRFSFDKTFPVTVFEFLQLSSPTCSKEKIMERLSHLGMEKMSGKLIGSLSGGQLQRVLAVRALLENPEILYLDEPASGIDVGGEENFYQMIFHLHKEHKTTVVMVSHEIDIVYGFADQVICINKSLLGRGAPQQVLTPELIQNLFGKEATIYGHTDKK